MILIVTDNLIYIKKHFKPANTKQHCDPRNSYLMQPTLDIVARYSGAPVPIEPQRFCNVIVIKRESVYGYSIDAESHTIQLMIEFTEKNITVQFDNQAEYDQGVENVKGIFFA